MPLFDVSDILRQPNFPIHDKSIQTMVKTGQNFELGTRLFLTRMKLLHLPIFLNPLALYVEDGRIVSVGTKLSQ